MDTNKMRACFEAMILADGKSIRRCGDSYHFGTVHRKWLFWQEAWRKSREAVEIELPPTISPCNTAANGYVRPEAEHYDEAIDDCREAIEAHGLRAKP